MTMRMPTAVFAVVLVLLAAGAAAQSTGAPPACASKLVGCAPYINGTGTPPDNCCGPLKDAVQNDLKCLCDLYASPEIFRAFNINLTDALRLSTRCGIGADASTCPSKAPGSSPLAPGSPSSGKSAGHRTVSASFAGLMSLFLVLWSALA